MEIDNDKGFFFFFKEIIWECFRDQHLGKRREGKRIGQKRSWIAIQAQLQIQAFTHSMRNSGAGMDFWIASHWGKGVLPPHWPIFRCRLSMEGDITLGKAYSFSQSNLQRGQDAKRILLLVLPVAREMIPSFFKGDLGNPSQYPSPWGKVGTEWHQNTTLFKQLTFLECEIWKSRFYNTPKYSC